MKLKGILFYGVLLLCQNVFAQSPRDVAFYLNSKEVSKTAKDYYNGKFKAKDDKRTISILDSLKTSNDKTRPFYIYLVSKISYKSDGALAETIGLTCKEFIENAPDHLIEFLYSQNKMVNRKFIDYWTNAIASEFMIDCEGKVLKCVKESLHQTLAKTKPINKAKLNQLYKQIERYCH